MLQFVVSVKCFRPNQSRKGHLKLAHQFIGGKYNSQIPNKSRKGRMKTACQKYRNR